MRVLCTYLFGSSIRFILSVFPSHVSYEFGYRTTFGTNVATRFDFLCGINVPLNRVIFRKYSNFCRFLIIYRSCFSFLYSYISPSDTSKCDHNKVRVLLVFLLWVGFLVYFAMRGSTFLWSNGVYRVVGGRGGGPDVPRGKPGNFNNAALVDAIPGYLRVTHSSSSGTKGAPCFGYARLQNQFRGSHARSFRRYFATGQLFSKALL